MTGVLTERETHQAAIRESPYVGLVPYSEEDAAFFFGREDDAEIIAANLKTLRMTLLYGASGVGKSSLLLAGVVPRLRELMREQVDGKTAFAVTVFRSWRTDPLQSLARAIELSVAEATDGAIPVASSRARLSDTVREGMKSVRTLLVVLDQFEDYFLYHPEEDGEGTFAGEFSEVMNDATLRVNVLISIREDAWAKLDRFEGRIPGLFGNYLRVDHLGWEAARRAIEMPVEEYNRWLPPGESPYSVEPDLVEVVLGEVKTGRLALVDTGPAVETTAEAEQKGQIETPFLQLVMERLWEAAVASESRELRTETLVRLGGAERIVKTYLGDIMLTLEPREQDIASELFRYLVTPSKTKIAHRAADLAYWLGRPEAEIEPVLKKLSERQEVRGESLLDKRSREKGARILRPLPLPAGETGASYEIFHDVLAEPILEWRRQHERKREKAALAAQIEAEQAAQRREARNKFISWAALVLLLLVAALAAVAAWAFHQRSIATGERNDARSSSDAFRAVTLLNTDPVLSVRIAVRAADISATHDAHEALRSALAEVRAVLIGHEGAVLSAAFSPDREIRIVTASDDGTARIWGAVSGRGLEILEGHAGPVTSATFSPDGTRVVTASEDKTARIWHAVSGDTVKILRGHTSPLTSAAFSPDGTRIVTASKDKSARIWDAKSGRSLKVLRGHRGPLSSAAFSPDGTRIVTASEDTTARIWDATSGRSLKVLRGHRGLLSSAAFSPDGTRIVTASKDKTARVWDATSGRSLEVLRGHTDPLSSAAFSPDGTCIVTASEDLTARIWDATSGRSLKLLPGHTGPLSSAAFSPDGTMVVTASNDKTARVWETSDEWSLSTLTTGAVPADVVFGRDGVLTITGSSDTARIQEVVSRQSLKPLRGTGAASLGAAAFNPDGTRVVTASDEGTAFVWDVASGRRLNVLRGHEGVVSAVSFSEDGRRIITTSLDGTARVWDAESGRNVQTLSDPRGGSISAASLGATGGLAVTGSSDGTVRIWNVSSGDLEHALRGHRMSVTAVSFSSDDRLVVTGSADGTVSVADASNGRTVVEFEGQGAPVYAAGFSSDGGLVVTGSADGNVRIWQVSTGRSLKLLRGHAGIVRAVRFDREGQRVITAGFDGTVRIYSCELCGSLEDLLALARPLTGSS